MGRGVLRGGEGVKRPELDVFAARRDKRNVRIRDLR